MTVVLPYRVRAAILSFLIALGSGLLLIPDVRATEDLEEVRLLARHGEPYAAWALLAQADDEGDDARILLEVRLLTELERYIEADSLLEHHTPLLIDRDIFRHTLQRGRLNYLAGRSERALDLLTGIDSLHHDSLAPYRDLLRMECTLAAGEQAAVIEVGEALVERGVPAAIRLRVDEILLQAHYLSGDAQKGVETSRRIQRQTRDSRARARVLAAEYELHVTRGDVESARATALELVRRHGRFAHTHPIAGEVVRDVGPDNMTVDELLAYARHLTSRRDYRGARRLFASLEKRQLTRAQKEASRIERADYHYRRGAADRAIKLAKPAFRNESHRRRSMLIVARSYRRSDRPGAAARMYEFFVKSYPSDAKAAEALFVASRIYERAGNTAARDRVLRALRQSYPSSYFGRIATLASAEAYVAQGEYGAAISILARRVKRSRRTDEAALFYLADAYRSAGDVRHNNQILNELQRLDPYSFYVRPGIDGPTGWSLTQGNGALLMQGEEGLLGFLDTIVDGKEASRQRVGEALAGGAIGGAPQPEHEACMQRGRWFLEAGFRDWGEGELEAARRQCLEAPSGMLELAALYDAYAMPWRSVQLYGRVKDRMHWKVRREYASDFRRLMFPVPFPVQVLENASRHRLPPHLVYAIIREESRFDVGAVSRVGALGLMQLMPETGRYVAHQMEMPEWGEDDLLKAEINVSLGVWYAAALAEQGDDDYLWMLSAYNAGPRNARRWFDDPDEDVVRAVDGIDYKETRNYVRRIVESANVYQDLYFSGSPRGAAQ